MQNLAKQVVLVIFDGWGYREERGGNAIEAAKKPCFDELWENSPHALLEASGKHVGLPAGEMGNSEVGHLTIGAGTVINTDVVRINDAFQTGEAKNNPVFQNLFKHVLSHDSTLHVMGLVSPGGIHSHEQHLYGFLRLAKESGIKKVVIHGFTDGRDTPTQSAKEYIGKLESVLKELRIGSIATLVGRYFAMDRDNNWDRVEKVVRAIFHGEGALHPKTPQDALKELYAENVWDEHVPVTKFSVQGGTEPLIKQNDGVLFFNFRADRARMLSSKIEERMHAMNLHYVIMTQYDKNSAARVAFPPVAVKTTLAQELSNAGKTQAHIAETEKYAHVTYFLNGGREEPHPKEEFILVDSHKDVATHDQAPEMRAQEITDRAIEQLNKGTDFIALNYANADMVGHTANYDATVAGVEAIDKNLARLVASAKERGAVLIITADHGNAEVLKYSDGAAHTAHTNNPVPVIISGLPASGGRSLRGGSLVDIAPTILTLFGIAIPKPMTGKMLLN